MDKPDFASIWSRFVALVIDGLVLLIPGALIHVGLPIGGPLLLSFLYYPIFHASPARATIGKRAMSIQVVDAHGDGISLGAAFLRHVFAIGSSCMAFIPHLVAFFTPRKQTVHDLIANTIVIKGETSTKLSDAWLSTVRKLFGAESTPI